MKAQRNKTIAVVSAIVIVVFFFSAFILCFIAYGNDPSSSTQLTASTSILANTLTFVVLVYAAIMWKEGKTSDIYKEKYVKKKDSEEIKKK